MKRFVFPLQRVLDFRQQQEEVERGRLAGLGAERRRLERQAEVQGSESRALRGAFAGRAVVEAAVLRQAFDSAESLLRGRQRSLELASIAEQRRVEQLDVVLEARRRVRLLELLRSRRRSRHRRQADREQEALAGELYLARLRREGPTSPVYPKKA